MRSARWQQVCEILDATIALPEAQRSSYLDQVCVDDPDLRAEVVSLLDSHEAAGSVFLNTPAADLKSVFPSSAPLSRAGRRIGVYQLIEEVGHGGMGEVYRARRVDGQYEKEVAIKFVRGGYDTAAVLERFLHERQILASLDHPNIARLYDGGTTDDGLPYLVMELIEGKPIDQYCDEQKLDLNERLRIFTQVCSAVQYAHQRLVIHRDIKPSNILVTADGTPKLLDFGIAKILDASSGAETTMVRPMTPEYASPEQIRGEPITTATDVYSLGVVLYRLLAGRSPYPATTKSSLDYARIICEFEPARPSTGSTSFTTREKDEKVGASAGVSNRRLRGDLDNITLKALRKEPPRRYGSVEQFAEDIRRHLHGLPVTATPDSLPYRARKFVQRHKVGVAATALIALAIAGGVLATMRQARIAEANRRRAEARFNDVRKLAHSVLFEFDEAIKNLPGSTPARSLVVKRALEYLDGLASEAHGDRSLQLEIASAYQKVAEVQGDPTFPNLGDSKGALQSSTKALAILETLSREEPDNPQVQLALAATHQQVSNVLNSTEDAAGALQHSALALKMYEGLAGKMAGDAAFQSDRLTETYHYANLLKLAGDLDQSVTEYRQAVELSQQMIAANPSSREGKLHLATSLDGLGNVLQEKGDTAGALENRRDGLAIREELVRLDPNDAHYRRQLAFSHHNVGLSLVEAGDIATALTHFRTELGLFEALSAADPKDVQGRRNRSLAHKQIGDVLMREADARGALAQYRAALDIDRGLANADKDNSQAILDLSFSESKAGSALGKLGQTQEALVLLRSGVARQESLVASYSRPSLIYHHLANSYTRLANCLLDSGDRKVAAEYYRKAVNARLTLAEKSPGSNWNRGSLAECYTNLAKALGPDNPGDALKQYNKAIELLDPLTAADRSNVTVRIALADALSNAARLHVQMAGRDEEPSTRLEDWNRAKSFYERSLGLWLELERTGKLPPDGNVAMNNVRNELARCNDSVAKLQQVH